MKYLMIPLLVLPVWLFGWLPDNSGPTSTAPAAAQEMETLETDHGHAPVVLELFTSQGCSSCPSADKVLKELANDPDVIALSFHVDYWNYLGWADPFSSPHYSARQREYTQQLRARTYTPQLVINGRQELVGSRKDEVRALVAQAKDAQRAYHPHVQIVAQDGKSVQLAYQLEGDLKDKRVSAVLVQRKASSSVGRGENRGRQLHHVNVVRDLVHAAASSKGKLELQLPNKLDMADTQVVLLVQDTGSRQILGAAKATLSAR